MNRMILILLTMGYASRYDPGVFKSVERVRGLPEWSGGHVAMADSSLVGQKVMICDEKHICWIARVTDCASKHDRQSETDPRSGYEWMIDGNVAGELDYDRGVSRVGTIIRIYQWTRRYEYE